MKVETKIVELPVDSLKPDPNQPRKSFPEDVIDNIAKTIKSPQGTINPIEADEKNIIITGEIRWRGAKKAGVTTVPVKRILEITPEERLERQIIENLHHTPLESVERENGIYSLWKSGRYKSYRELANTVGYSEQTIQNYIEAKEFRDKKTLAARVSTRVIVDTKGLPEEDRERILRKVEREELIPEKVRDTVRIVKKTPEPIKEKFLAGEIPEEKAEKIVEVYEKAPEPLKEAIAKEEVEPERAKEIIEVIEGIKKEGHEIEPSRISIVAEEMKKEARVGKAEQRLRKETFKEILAGKKEGVDTIFRERGRMFVQEVKDVAWKVKGWGIPHMKVVGAENWKEAQKYFKQIHDHMEMLLRASPIEES